MVGVLCYDCGALNAGSTKFCIECGTRMAVRDDRVACPACNSPNAAGAKFCVECGTRMAVRDEGASCPVCNSLNAAGAKFCVECGAALAGFALVQQFLPHLPRLVRLCGGYLAGIVLTAWTTFLPALALSPATDSSLMVGIFFATAINAGVIAFFWPELDRLAPKAAPFAAVIAAWAVIRLAVPNQWESPIPLILLVGLAAAAVSLALRRQVLTDDRRALAFELILLAAALVFSTWLMDARLSGTPLTVSSNTWGDTGLHVSLARSFSEGHNYPPEYPFYGGEPIRYHFGYDFFAGALEDAGLPIRLAFNLPGALGFTALIVLVFELARWLFRNVAVGLMAVVLLITNSSFAFLRYFQLYNVSSVFDLAGISKAVSHLWDRQPAPFTDRYLAVGPYFVEGRVAKISLFWTLNVFLT